MELTQIRDLIIQLFRVPKRGKKRKGDTCPGGWWRQRRGLFWLAHSDSTFWQINSDAAARVSLNWINTSTELSASFFWRLLMLRLKVVCCHYQIRVAFIFIIIKTKHRTKSLIANMVNNKNMISFTDIIYSVLYITWRIWI